MLKYDSFRSTVEYEITTQRSQNYERILGKHMNNLEMNTMKRNIKRLLLLNNS